MCSIRIIRQKWLPLFLVGHGNFKVIEIQNNLFEFLLFYSLSAHRNSTIKNVSHESTLFEQFFLDESFNITEHVTIIMLDFQQRAQQNPCVLKIHVKKYFQFC
jgi:hypothetical protein